MTEGTEEVDSLSAEVSTYGWPKRALPFSIDRPLSMHGQSYRRLRGAIFMNPFNSGVQWQYDQNITNYTARAAPMFKWHSMSKR